MHPANYSIHMRKNRSRSIGVRFFRALLIFLAALLASAAVAAWLVPRYLDWNRYRDDVTRLAAAVLDRPVLIQGPISLRLLPEPVLTAADVRIAGEPDQGSLSAGQLSLSVALGPLLAGRLDARDLVLRGVDLKLPWPLPESAFPARRPAWLAGLSARIENGRLSVGKVVITHVAARLAISGPTGGYSLSGTGQAFGHVWRVDAALGAAGADDTAPLDLTLSGEGALHGTQATFAGEISPGGMGGRISAKGPDLALLLPAPKVAFSAEGRLTVASGLAVADNLALLIGGAPAHGAVSLRTKPALRVDLAVRASRLDLDSWLPVLLRTHGLSYPVGIDLSAEAAPLAGGVVRQLRIASEIDRGTVAIRDVRGVLPGEAHLRVSGRIIQPAAAAVRDPPLRFEGKVALAAPDLRATLRWLDPKGRHGLETLPSGVLRTLDLSASAAVRAGRLTLSNLAGKLDASHVNGLVNVGLSLFSEPATPRGPRARAGLRVVLKSDRLDLDPWLPAAAPSPARLAKLLRSLDVDVQLQAASATVAGIAVSDLVLNGAATGGRLSIRHAEARALGLQANVSGSIDASGRITHARLAFTTQDASQIGGWLAPVWRATLAFWRAPLLVWVEADGPASATAVTARLLLGKTDLGMQAQLDWPTRGAASFALNAPAAALVLRQAGFADLATAFGDGPLAAQLRLGIAPDRIGVDGIRLVAGELRADGDLSIDRTGQEPRVVGSLAADTLPLPPYDLRSPNPLPFEALRGWEARVQLAAKRIVAGPAGAARTPVAEQASATLGLRQGRLRLQDIQAKLLGGGFSGEASLQAGSESPALALRGKLSDVRIPGPLTGAALDIVGGRADADLDLTAAGHSPATMLATLGGSVHVSVREGVLAGFDLPALDAALHSASGQSDLNPALKAALASGRTAFDRLNVNATASRGILQLGKAEMTAPSGSAVLTGSIDLPDASIDLHAAIRPASPDLPVLGLTITGPANAPRHLPDLADVTRWQNQAAQAH